MIDIATLSPPVQAATLVVAISIEALVLYGGYGLLERVVAPPLLQRIANT
ncbi:MAG: hypothetical protein U5K37_06100 [Natrialbaceae archaeon]|nr:hypothetical protein [Natrialbaceae archaeon]